MVSRQFDSPRYFSQHIRLALGEPVHMSRLASLMVPGRDM